MVRFLVAFAPLACHHGSISASHPRFLATFTSRFRDSRYSRASWRRKSLFSLVSSIPTFDRPPRHDCAASRARTGSAFSRRVPPRRVVIVRRAFSIFRISPGAPRPIYLSRYFGVGRVAYCPGEPKLRHP